jgi:hypothetical protein
VTLSLVYSWIGKVSGSPALPNRDVRMPHSSDDGLVGEICTFLINDADPPQPPYGGFELEI